ncbi:MAG: TetR/AcrR family transcriptional regulator [Thermoprotei archaeon]
MRNSNNEKKKLIIMSARQIFADKGFDLATVDEIMEKAKLSKGTFYTYFSSKEQLIKEIAISVSPVEVLNSVIEKEYNNVKEMLNDLALKYILKYSNLTERKLFLYSIGIANRYNEIKEIFKKIYHMNYIKLKEKIQNLTGKMVDEIYLKIFLGSLFYYVISMNFAERIEQPYEYVQKIVDLLLSSMIV